jgi:mycothiol synthase
MGRYGVMSTGSDFVFRKPRMNEDVPAATKLLHDWEVAEFGWSGIDDDDLRADWSAPGTDIDGNALLALTTDGQLAGFMNLHARPPFTDLSVACPVATEFMGLGLGAALLAHAERRATAMVERTPAANEPSFLRQWTGRNSGASIELLAAHGYTPTRALLTMQMDLRETVDHPAAPEGIDIRPLIAGREERAYYEAEEEAFANHWGFQPVTFEQFQHYVLDSPKWDPTLAFLALDGDDVAGVMLMQAGTSWDEDLGWFDDLAVREPWRRRGIARALMDAGFAELRSRGSARAGLEVDSENDYGAVALYESVGMREIDRVVPYEKRLR